MAGTQQEFERVVSLLREAQSVCIITHLRPDADAVGSATALGLGLRQLGKDVSMVIGQRREVPANLLTIPGARDIQTASSLPTDFDVYVTVDCGSLDRTGCFAEELAALDNLVCIDHHASNPGFGQTNLVRPECESTTVLLTKVLDMAAVQIDRDIAHCLYAGLVTDTGSFRWGRPVMHDYAHRYMQYGIDTKQIAVDLIDSTNADDIQMIGRVLAGLQIVPAGQYQVGILVAALEDTAGHSESSVESLVDFVRALEGTDLGVVFKEQETGVWAVSLRSSQIDCAELAGRLGGGGHVPAAGYTTQGSAEDIIAQLVAALRG
ncbi:bifunctional oligoribonuclease/PAP phosphatase NrnA [Corynebacterium lizhenjunii]|uniref:Bifunctional oligoribonuclease/PAP phosphatase NrnA n=1 Tax=Corynebacterium lizhenjunii TaxID=2709394 RepID=A0A7T0KED3_9CORY|nr:bifunctional oligoribonuclease/PAP phosphatase NrnA [Corynebacterium lizhenjunii]QPK78394.1 bifunctional oligoribonuclease/PAP phosphatase NrnA [Corynebacterium lizhenjunii]